MRHRPRLRVSRRQDAGRTRSIIVPRQKDVTAVTALIPILLLGTLILTVGCGLLVQWLRTDYSRPVTIEDYSAARAALDTVFVETAAIKRIFAAEDAQFVAESGSQE